MHLAAQVPAACGRCAGKPDAPDKQLRTHRWSSPWAPASGQQPPGQWRTL